MLARPSSRLLLSAVAAASMAGSSCGPPDASAGDDPFGSVRTVEGPLVRIGAVDDSAYAFTAVLDLTVGPDGSVYSLHFNEAALRRWTSGGRAAGKVGREGEGPGEFTRPDAIGFFGDSLWVMDGRAYRVSYFDADGSYLGSTTPRVNLGSRDSGDRWASPPRPERPLRDGTFYGRSPAWSEAIARGQLTAVPHVHMDAEGTTLSTIWTQPYRSTDVWALLREGGGTFTSQPFGDGSLAGLSPDGHLVVVERRVHDGEGPAVFRVTKMEMDGDTAFHRAITYEPEPLPPSRVDSAVAARAEGLYSFMSQRDGGLTQARLERDLREATYVPSHTPAVSGMAVAADGSIWLRRPGSTAEGMEEWWILDPAGQPAGSVHLPPGLRVLHVDGDDVWGAETDELDVDYIVRYRLTPEGRVAPP